MLNRFEQHSEAHIGPVREYALRAFGQDEAENWLNTSWRVFNSRTPLDMAREEAGASKVLSYIKDLTSAEEMLAQADIRHKDF